MIYLVGSKKGFQSILVAVGGGPNKDGIQCGGTGDVARIFAAEAWTIRTFQPTANMPENGKVGLCSRRKRPFAWRRRPQESETVAPYRMAIRVASVWLTAAPVQAVSAAKAHETVLRIVRSFTDVYREFQKVRQVRDGQVGPLDIFEVRLRLLLTLSRDERTIAAAPEVGVTRTVGANAIRRLPDVARFGWATKTVACTIGGR